MKSDIYKLVLINVAIVSIWLSQVGPVLVSKPYHTTSASPYQLIFLFTSPLIVIIFGYFIIKWKISNRIVVPTIFVPYAILSILTAFFFYVKYINFISFSFSIISVTIGVICINMNITGRSMIDNTTSQEYYEQNSPERDSKQNDSYIKTIQGSDQSAEDINTRRPKDESE